MYASVSRMSGNNTIFIRDFGDSSQFTNWVLDSGSACHMTPEVSGFIPGSLEDTDKYIEFSEQHHVTAKQKVKVQINVCNNNGDNFIGTLHNVLLAPDLCDRLFSIVTLMNLGHTCFYNKGFCMVYFGDEEEIWLLYHTVHSRNMHFWGK